MKFQYTTTLPLNLRVDNLYSQTVKVIVLHSKVYPISIHQHIWLIYEFCTFLFGTVNEFIYGNDVLMLQLV